MTIILTTGLTLIGGAAICQCLDAIGQEKLSHIIGITVTLSLILFLSSLVMTTSWDIINLFGGLPKW